MANKFVVEIGMDDMRRKFPKWSEATVQKALEWLSNNKEFKSMMHDMVIDFAMEELTSSQEVPDED